MDYAKFAVIARAFLKLQKVYRYHLKKIRDMDDQEVITACHHWYTDHHMEKEYRSFENYMLTNRKE